MGFAALEGTAMSGATGPRTVLVRSTNECGGATGLSRLIGLALALFAVMVSTAFSSTLVCSNQTTVVLVVGAAGEALWVLPNRRH